MSGEEENEDRVWTKKWIYESTNKPPMALASALATTFGLAGREEFDVCGRCFAMVHCMFKYLHDAYHSWADSEELAKTIEEMWKHVGPDWDNYLKGGEDG